MILYVLMSRCGYIVRFAGKLSSGRSAVAGALAGFTETIVNCPFEV